jgi:hypothetical protein
MVELKITVDDAGKISVNGPISNRMLCYGMLEMARDAINKFVDQNQSPIVQVPPGTIVPKLHQ